MFSTKRSLTEGLSEFAEHMELLNALDRHCTCTFKDGALVDPCPGHKALATTSFQNHMRWLRLQAPRLIAEEFSFGGPYFHHDPRSAA